MKSVAEVSTLTGISVRTLHYYDAIGLLKPAHVTEAGYRYYDDAALERLYLILLLREIGFSLKEIGKFLDAPDHDRNHVLQQIELLEKKRQRLAHMTTIARGLTLVGTKHLELEGFNVNKLEDYTAQAKTLYGKTQAYKEYEQKSRSRTPEQNASINGQVMDFFVRLGGMKDLAPESDAVQAWVQELQSYFTQYFYTCTPQILQGLGQMYAGGGSMTENIDAAGGEGTGEFARRAIDIYIGR